MTPTETTTEYQTCVEHGEVEAISKIVNGELVDTCPLCESENTMKNIDTIDTIDYILRDSDTMEQVHYDQHTEDSLILESLETQTGHVLARDGRRVFAEKR